MLVVSFSIAVDEDRADEMRDIITNYYGISIVHEELRNENLCWSEPVPRVYFKCFAPYSRFEMLAGYVQNVYTGTAILSY